MNPHHPITPPQKLCAGQGPAPWWSLLSNLSPFPALRQGDPKALPGFAQEKLVEK